MRVFRIFAAATILAFGLVPAPSQAGWNQWARFFGECWSDGYHAPGDPWNRPPQARHASHSHHIPARAFFYPPVAVPAHSMGGEQIQLGNPVSTQAILEIETP